MQLYGPDGVPLVVKRPDGQLARVVNPETFLASQEDAIDAEIRKRVRSQAVSIGATWDKARGRPKPTPVTYETLRLMAQRNEWVRAIIIKRQGQIGGKKFDIVLRDGDDPSGAAKKAARSVKKLLLRPGMHGSKPNSRSWRQFIAMWVDDLLTLDRACIEKERDGNGWIKALYPVDGATIRPNMDDQGGYLDDSYVQLVDGQTTARFGMEELIVSMAHEQTDVRFAGYGLSPLESLIISVTADLYAAKYNSTYFEKGSVPEGLLSLGEDATPEDVNAFRQYWANEIQGRPWALPVVGGAKDPQFVDWRKANRDMQFQEFQEFLLQKISAVFQCAPKDLGAIDDVNRSTAEDATSNSDEAGVEPIAALIKEWVDLEIIGEHGQGLSDYLEFEWEESGESVEEINAKFQPAVGAGAATRRQWAEALGLEIDENATGAEGLSMYLSDGQPSPLPSSEDVQHMGAAAEQAQQAQQQEQEWSRQDQQDKASQEQEHGGPPTTVPWKPADPNHPDTQAAMAAHDADQGIGPRAGAPAPPVSKVAPDAPDVAKAHPTGHDRNPAMTDRTDALEQLWTRETDSLFHRLKELLEA